MWHEYPIESNFERQKSLIRNLRTWIEQLQSDKLIVGYCFDHYASNPEEPDELRIRFQYADEKYKSTVEEALKSEVKKYLPNYALKKQLWGNDDATDRHILQAYELGSRCAFLAWRLIEEGRFTEGYFSRAIVGQNQEGLIANKIPVEFQFHFSHGVMNSLGIPKVPDELNIHLNNLMDATKSKTKQDLINWLQANLKG